MKHTMKTLLSLFAVVFALSVRAENKLLSESTYSVANYKHVNKAIAARQWEPEAGIEFRKRVRQPMNIATYRALQRLGGLGDPAIAIPSTPSLANRNYKQQNQLVDSQPSKNEVVAVRSAAD